MSTQFVLATVLIAALISSACTTIEPTPERNVHVLGEADVTNGMRSMADHLFNLTGMTLSTDSAGDVMNAKILRELETIGNTAKGLGGSNQITNYSVINRYMGSFIYDVQLASAFARRSPPNYVPANRLIKSCMSCHESF